MSCFRDCKWCYGKGCNQCNEERRKAVAEFEKNGFQPIFTAHVDNPDDMRRLKQVLGMEALEHAFGPDGDGMQEIERNAAIASLLQLINKCDLGCGHKNKKCTCEEKAGEK